MNRPIRSWYFHLKTDRAEQNSTGDRTLTAARFTIALAGARIFTFANVTFTAGSTATTSG